MRGYVTTTADGAATFTTTQGIHCNVSGTYDLRFAGDDEDRTLELVAGMSYPFHCVAINAGTVTDLVLLY